jgi:hypothetical protein
VYKPKPIILQHYVADAKLESKNERYRQLIDELYRSQGNLHCSQPQSPKSLVTRGMQYSKDHDSVGSHNVKSSIRKPSRKNPTYMRMFSYAQICQWVFEGAIDGSANLSGDLQSQARFPGFVPERGVKNVFLSFRADD